MLIPYVTRQYEKTRKVCVTLHQLIAELISAVERTKEKEKVLCIRSDCTDIHEFVIYLNHMSQILVRFRYSKLSRKRSPLVHDKVVAKGRWSLVRKMNKINAKLT